MFARVSVIEGSPEQVDEGMRLIREQVMPRAAAMSGMKGIINLADRAGGTSMTITLWESEEALRASEEGADQLRSQAAQQLGGTIRSVERYEVTIFEV